MYTCMKLLISFIGNNTFTSYNNDKCNRGQIHLQFRFSIIYFEEHTKSFWIYTSYKVIRVFVKPGLKNQSLYKHLPRNSIYNRAGGGSRNMSLSCYQKRRIAYPAKMNKCR